MNVKTINLTGEETEINFGREYVFVEINNSSNSEILISASPDIVRGNDDVMIISSRTIGTLGDVGIPKLKKIYAKGTGEIQVIGKDYAEHCFKLPAYGDGSDVKPVLDFLPHPEGIYAYWDWEHGVENYTWTDMVNGTVINTINDNSFVVQDGYLSLRNTGDDTDIKVKNFDSLVIYIVIDSAWTTSQSDKRYILYNGNGGIYHYRWSTTNTYYLRFGTETTSGNIIEKATANPTKTYALINTPNLTTGIDEGLVQGNLAEQIFANHLGLHNNTVKFKAILLSDNISNIDHIEENITALHNKYFPQT